MKIILFIMKKLLNFKVCYKFKLNNNVQNYNTYITYFNKARLGYISFEINGILAYWQQLIRLSSLSIDHLSRPLHVQAFSNSPRKQDYCPTRKEILKHVSLQKESKKCKWFKNIIIKLDIIII